MYYNVSVYHSMLVFQVLIILLELLNCKYMLASLKEKPSIHLYLLAGQVKSEEFSQNHGAQHTSN